jgi:3-oxoacyl-[acyl-carrier-protein] synthase III
VNDAMAGSYPQIAAIDYALPERTVTNAELASLHPDWKLSQVAERTGVLARHWCTPSETALDLAEAACRRLQARAPGLIEQSDAILFCTQSPDYWMPPNACLLQDRLGLPQSTAALDYSLACSGYVYGLYLAKALLMSESARRVLLVAAETYSKWMHPGDRGPMSLFGDGAAVTVLTLGGDVPWRFSVGTNGAGRRAFCVPAGAARTPRSAATSLEVTDTSGNVRTSEHLIMDGASVLDFVKREMPRVVNASLRDTGIALESIDLVLFHQASQVGLDYLNEALHIRSDQRFSNMSHIGNTVSASLPIALRDAESQGRLRPGMRVLLVGFGVGLSWGVGVITWNPSVEA